MTAQRNSGTGAPTKWSCSHNALASALATETTATAYLKVSGGEDHQPGFDLAMKRRLGPGTRLLTAAGLSRRRRDADTDIKSRPTMLGTSHKVQLSYLLDGEAGFECEPATFDYQLILCDQTKLQSSWAQEQA